MAEFVEIMNIKHRMDNYYEDCSCCCPLFTSNFCYLPEESLTTEDFKEAERIMLKWAEEHPVEYPYMIDVLYDVFNMPKGLNVSNTGIWEWLNTIRISEEMAVKLGIEPKERQA